MEKEFVVFTYMNHRGEQSQRFVEVDALEFLNKPGFGYQPGWFLSGWCSKAKARRSFALSRIVFDELSAHSVVPKRFELVSPRTEE